MQQVSSPENKIDYANDEDDNTADEDYLLNQLVGDIVFS